MSALARIGKKKSPMTQQERSAKSAEKRKALNEEDLRLRVRPGTKQALSELMEWADLEEQGEALTLMIHHLHALGKDGAIAFLTPPRHIYQISENVARKLEREGKKESINLLNEDL